MISEKNRISVLFIISLLLFITPLCFSAENQTYTDELMPLNENETFSNFLTARRWSPYIAGAGIGILSWLSFFLSDKALGVSSAFVRSSGMIEKKIHPKKVEEKSYYQKFTPKIDWEWMLVFGLLIGAFVSAITSGDFEFEMIPSIWAEKFGTNGFLRWLVALTGGFALAIGARWAGGCTSGHGISGTLQLVVSSWIAVICFFIGGVVTALILY